MTVESTFAGLASGSGLLGSSTAGYADSGRKQFVHSLGKEGRIRLIPVWVAGEMAPYRRNWSEFGLPKVRHFGGVFGYTEVAIGLAWHDECLGFDRTQGFHKVSSIHLVRADVGILPAPKLRQQVVGIVLLKIASQKPTRKSSIVGTPSFL